MRPFKLILKFTIIFTLILVFYGCPTPCDEIKTNIVSSISDSILNYIPYTNGDEVILEHSEGAKIIFTAQRESTTEIFYCEHCCDSWEYQIDRTILTPEYPINSIEMKLSKPDENYVGFSLRFGISTFLFSTAELNLSLTDSVLLNNKFFYNVYALSSEQNQNYYGNDFTLFADSLYYNFELGIIKITMSNDEYYFRYEQ